MKILHVLAPMGALLAMSSSAMAADSTSAAAGKLIAQRNCASCHDIANGQSPLADAPPFARLHWRYGPGGLAELLEKGMIADWPRPLEEGSRPVHPRMPALSLSEDEVVALADYLRTFEPSSKKTAPPARK